MGMKKVNTEFVQLKAGDKVTGYLLSVGEQPFDKQGGAPGEVNVVPTLVMQRKADGVRFKVLLGQAVVDDVKLLKFGVLTLVEKPKEARRTRKGNNVFEYSLSQDLEDVLAGA